MREAKKKHISPPTFKRLFQEAEIAQFTPSELRRYEDSLKAYRDIKNSMDTEKQRIEMLVKQLNAASAAYYNGQDEIMSNYEWDALFDELTELEKGVGEIGKGFKELFSGK